jgi:phosphate-selective porin OprO/OprP
MTKVLIPQMVRIGLLILVVVLIPTLGSAEAAEPEKILIRNVRVIDRSGKTDDRSVSILIKDTKLNVITMDEVGLEEGLVGYDARNGILMGIMNIGQPANFMILDGDPREDIEVLLDTKSYVVFAIRQGTIVRNMLPPIGAPAPEEKEEKKTSWLAYTPPPMALPLTYSDSTKWNRWDTRYFSGIFVAALALDRQRWLTQDENSTQQVDGLKEYEGGEIRALRVGIAGTLNFKKPWYYQFVLHTHAFDQGYDSKTSDDVTFLDYRLNIPFWKQLTLSVGKQKEPISMDRLLIGTQLQMAERATVLDAMFQVRNFGIVVSGAGFLGGRMTGAIGVFNDWLVTSGESFDESASQVTARVTGLAFVSEDESNMLHLALGARYNDAKEGLRYRARPEFNQAPAYVDTEGFVAEHTLTYDLEVALRRGPFWFTSE